MGRVEKSSEMKFRGRIENFLSWLAMILNFLDSLVGDCWFWYICAALEEEGFSLLVFFWYWLCYCNSFSICPSVFWSHCSNNNGLVGVLFSLNILICFLSGEWFLFCFDILFTHPFILKENTRRLCFCVF